jgi:hypothetical protein
MDDIAPALLEKIRSAFKRLYDADSRIKSLLSKVSKGTATYQESLKYAQITGELLSKALQGNISSSILPDGKMYFNIAQRILQPTLKNNYDLVSDVAQNVQQSLNDAAGIGLKAQKAVLNQDKIDGIINRISSEGTFDDVSWILGEPVTNFTMSVADDTLKENIEFQGKAGMAPKIVRKSAFKCCDWCESVVGTYTYPDVPKDVYRRHDNCRCTVDYVAGDKKTSVHSGQEGKRNYQVVHGMYEDYYVMSKEKRAQHLQEMQATASERKAAARQKRIDTWAKKKAEKEIMEGK